MPYVNVPKDLSAIKTKLALGLTKRQLICFGIGGAIGIPTFFLARKPLGNEGGILLMIGVMLPFFLLAMYERDGQPAEKLAANYIRARWLWPRTRSYRTENLYRYLEEQEESNFVEKDTPAGPSGKAAAHGRKTGKTKSGRS